jgi:hypothetical protein
LQPGFLDFDGFASVNLAARDALLAEGLVVCTPGALAINAELSVASGGKVSLRSDGDLSVDGAAAPRRTRTSDSVARCCCPVPT